METNVHPEQLAPEQGGKIAPLNWTREAILDRHVEWLQSKGETGARADFSGADLQDADLTGADLQGAILNKATLTGADLVLANLRKASLVQANLQDARLLGAALHEADLQGATLTNANGLRVEQLAAANLFSAEVPSEIHLDDSVTDAAAAFRQTGWLLAILLAVAGVIALRVATTTDAQLLGDAVLFPSARLRALPVSPVYLLVPILLLGAYVWFHLRLQRLWESLAGLPAIFPDGRRLDAGLPWYAAQAVRLHLKWLSPYRSRLAFLENALASLLLYWIIPATLLLLWGRYLTLQDLRGSMLHVLLVVTASAAALHFSAAARDAFHFDAHRSAPSGSKFLSLDWRRPRRAVICLLALGLVFSLLSFGAILGAPHGGTAASPSRGVSVRTLAADAFWLVGFSPFAQVTGAELSTRPPAATERPDALDSVQGARLGGARLRHIQAYGAFLAKANLWQADLEAAELSESDLREINARRANFQSAQLDRANLERAILQQANFDQADLTRANLRAADLSYASLQNATLVDSTMDAANLYGSNLRGASLQRAALSQADLRAAHLEGADLRFANLASAYLSSAAMAGAQLQGAQLKESLLTQANLRGADLRGANLTGAALNGANLEGANLRSAVGLDAGQLCSAEQVASAQLDDSLRHDVDALCGAAAH